MNTVLKDSELVAPSADRCLVLVVDVSDGPEWVLAPLSLGINEARPKSHAHRNVVKVFNRYIVKLAMLVDDLAYDLQLVVSIAVNVGLEGLLSDDLVGETLYLDLDLEGVALQDHELVSEVSRVLIDRNPDGHCIILELAVHLIHVKTIIEVLLKPENVLLALSLLPKSHLALEPTFLAENLEATLAPQELGDKEIRLLTLCLQ